MKAQSRFIALMGLIASAGASYAQAAFEDRAELRSRSPTIVGCGPGWGRAKVKRMAKKRRNVLRNRRAHRG